MMYVRKYNFNKEAHAGIFGLNIQIIKIKSNRKKQNFS